MKILTKDVHIDIDGKTWLRKQFAEKTLNCNFCITEVMFRVCMCSYEHTYCNHFPQTIHEFVLIDSGFIYYIQYTKT